MPAHTIGLCPHCGSIPADDFVHGWRGWICGSYNKAHDGEPVHYVWSNACASMRWRVRAEKAEAKLRRLGHVAP